MYQVIMKILRSQEGYMTWEDGIPLDTYGHSYLVASDQGFIVVDDIYNEDDSFKTYFSSLTNMSLADIESLYGDIDNAYVFSSMADARQEIREARLAFAETETETTA